MRYQWLTACAAVVILLLAATPFLTGDRDGPTGDAADPANETPWDKARRESAEALQATGQATKDSTGKVWNAAKTASARAWRSTKEAVSGTWNAAKQGADDAAQYSKEKSRSAWESMADFWAGLAGDSKSD